MVYRHTGETVEVDAEEVVRIVGVEIGYVDWAIEVDGSFENKDWNVTRSR